MEPEDRRFWLIALTLAVIILGLVLFVQVEEELQPEFTRAWVAIQGPGAEVAKVGSVTIDAGGEFVLHAVLEAETFLGDTIYFTEAPRLELPDGEVEPDKLRRWRGELEARVFWFSVEAPKPYLEVSSPADLEQLEFRDFFLADWPRTWSVSGKWGGPSAGVTLPPDLDYVPFGTRRFRARIEIYGPESRIHARERVSSWKGEDLLARLEHFPTVLSLLPGTLASPSRAFGLPQLELAEGAAPGTAEAIADWRSRKIGFSRLGVIKGALDAAGVDPDELDWQAVELVGEADWEAGDLLRVGERWVLTYEDRGIEGRLDEDDFCFDFDKGAAVRRLGDIFVGDGLVERARL